MTIWVGFISFQCRPSEDSGIKVIKEDQTEFLTIKVPGGIMILNVTAYRALSLLSQNQMG